MKVAFIGHRHFKKNLHSNIVVTNVVELVEKLIRERGANEFIIGSMTGFDYMGYLAVTNLKNEMYPQIKRIYLSQYVKFPYKSRRIMNEFFEKCEFPLKSLLDNYHQDRKRNELIVDACDILIIYYGNGFEEVHVKDAYNYAMAKGKKIINLFDENDAKNIVF